MRLIDAEALKTELLKAPVWTGLDVMARINAMPSIDIVRCSECVYSNGVGQYCQNDHFVNEDTFCSYGEREGE